jgi:hypothetical protein
MLLIRIAMELLLRSIIAPWNHHGAIIEMNNGSMESLTFHLNGTDYRIFFTKQVAIAGSSIAKDEVCSLWQRSQMQIG